VYSFQIASLLPVFKLVRSSKNISRGKTRQLEGAAMQFDSQKLLRIIQDFEEESKVT